MNFLTLSYTKKTRKGSQKLNYNERQGLIP